VQNILSIDLESWVHFYKDFFKDNLEGSKERKKLDNSYIVFATNNILKVLDKCNAKATFFVLGEIFEWYPEIIYGILQAGHEIGYHTHDHQPIKNEILLEKQLEKSKLFIDTFRPKGFRAPQIYLTKDSAQILKEWGFEYSSSTYGPYSRKTNVQGIEELPVSSFSYLCKPPFPITFPQPLTLKMFLKEIPFGSGLFFSVFQSKISFFIKRLEERGEPAILFFHPWQIYKINEIHGAKFRLKVLCKNFLALPYTISMGRALEVVLSKHQFTSFGEFRNGHKKILGS